MEKNKEMMEKVLEDVLNTYKKKAKTKEMIETAIKYKENLLEFKDPDENDLLDISEEEKIARDTFLFKTYNQGVESVLRVANVTSEMYENVIKFEFKGKEVVVGFNKNRNYSEFTDKNVYDFTFLMNISNKKRLHIQTYSFFSKNTPYERSFIDYEKYLEKYDLENDESFKEIVSDRLYEWKNKKELNSLKYQLSESEKEFLRDVYVTNGFQYTVVLKDGVICIQSEFNTFGFYKSYVKKIACFIDCITQILEKFMNI